MALQIKDYSTLFDCSREAVWITDRAGRILYSNPAAGQSPYLNDVTEILSDHLPEYEVYPNFSLQCSQLNSEGHYIARLFERNRENFYNYFIELFEKAPIGIAITDAEGTIEETNRYFAELLDYRPEELVGLSFKDISDENSHDEEVGLINDVLSGRRNNYRIEKYYITRGGRKVYIDLTAHFFRDENDNVIQIMGVVVDISARKEAFKNLQNEIVKSREAVRMKEQFLAVMSHELRTPLNGILGMTTLLEQNYKKDIKPQYLEIIRSSSNSLLHLIDDLLVLSDPAYFAEQISPKQINTLPFLEEFLSLLAGRAAEKDLNFQFEPDINIPRAIKTDERVLRQIILNLAGNAIKFTEKGDVRIRVGFRHNRLEIVIADSGKGINPEMREKAFKPFAASDFSRNRPYSGAGIGLALTSRMIEFLNADLTIKTKIKTGTVVKASIPVESVKIDERPVKKQKGRVRFYYTHLRYSRNIAAWVEKWGYRTELISLSETDAISAGDNDDFIIIETDLPNLPKLTGPKFNFLTKNELDKIILLKPAAMRTIGDLPASIRSVRRSTPITDLYYLLRGHNEHYTETGARDSVYHQIKTGKRRILIVEDNPVNRTVLTQMLINLGYESVSVDNGEKALNRLDEADPDIIFMDLHMPGRDGISTTEEIRKRGSTDAKIIALTADTTPGLKEKLLQSGFDYFINKPISLKELSDLLK